VSRTGQQRRLLSLTADAQSPTTVQACSTRGVQTFARGVQTFARGVQTFARGVQILADR